MIKINIKEAFFKIKKFVFGHKIMSIIFILLLTVAGYFGYKSLNSANEETLYILTSVEKGMITTTISGTGQIESADSKDIKAEASGKITYLNPNIKIGNTVAKGTLMAVIDNTDALRTIEDKKRGIENAEDNLETALISLDKLIGADESNPTVKKDAEKNLVKAYEDGYNVVSSVFLDLPSIMSGLNSILYGKTFNGYQENIDYYTYGAYTYNEDAMTYKNSVNESYMIARADYDKIFLDYKNSSIYSETAEIFNLITETYNTTKKIAQALKDAINLIQFYEDALTSHSVPTNSTATTHISSLSSYLSKANSNISSLFNSTSTIDNNTEAVTDSTYTIRTAKLSVKSKEQALEDARVALTDAEDALSDYYIYANLTGIISAMNIKKGENISSGSTAATIITNSKIAKIVLSESDIANIKVGNKAMLTFDAIEDLTITGEVINIDPAGTANSGVVSYGIEIALDIENDSVKSGMSVSSTIITNSKNDVLTVPTTTVKSQSDGAYYIQALNDTFDLTDKSNLIKGVASSTAPIAKMVTIGLSDDTNTEITGGLSEGDQIVVRVSTSNSSATTTSSNNIKNNSNSILNSGGMMGGGPPMR